MWVMLCCVCGDVVMLIPDLSISFSCDIALYTHTLPSFPLSVTLSLLSLFHTMPNSINTTDSFDDEEDRPVCTHQESSLGISQALKPSGTTSKRDSRVKTSLRDETLPEASETDNLFIWARFYISLYYNKVRIRVMMCVGKKASD